MNTVLKAPLFTQWDAQYIRIPVGGLEVGAPVGLTIAGRSVPFQYTGETGPEGAEVMLQLGFDENQTHELEFAPVERSETNLSPETISLETGAVIGSAGCEIEIPSIAAMKAGAGPFAGCGGFPLGSQIFCERKFDSCQLTRLATGPLFTDYELDFRFSENHFYTLRFRCYAESPFAEVAETFHLGMNSELRIVFNPAGDFNSILSRDNFEGETQPEVEALGQEHPRDILCRLQMPVLSEYFIPNNRGWFAFFNSQRQDRGMLGVLGLYGDRWRHAVDNMPILYDSAGEVEWRSALGEGERHWLLYRGEVETGFTPSRRFVFHRLHAEFNGLRLDQHLDLSGETIFDASCWQREGFWGENYRELALAKLESLPPLRSIDVDNPGHRIFRTLIDPTEENNRRLYDGLISRFEKWVRDFQGYRSGEHDYLRNVIGFARELRILMMQYELLRKDRFLNDEQVARLSGYFAFAARRILDEGRWPHSKTWLHPDHPESVRDLYTYPGEHKPDKLVWTNSLPNFQSDPMCALIHLSALIPDHPDAAVWQRFALDDLERNLDAYCSPSGAWEESINYALFTLSYFIITFRVLKNRTGLNYFQDERMRRFLGWLTRFFGPYDKRSDAYTFPGVGNAVVPQTGAENLLAYAGELEEGDPLRDDLIAIYQKSEPALLALRTLNSNPLSPLLMAAMAPVPARTYPLRQLQSEHMIDLGVAMRQGHPSPRESYLFQKIGFWKDHYENDESSFNWYAKGTPLVMDYGTYSPDIAVAAAHNLVEIPDMDSLRRGYLADSYLTEAIDYTRCEVPVTLKLQHGRLRSFDEIDGPPQPPLYFYIGDNTPMGPKVWKTRMLLFAKPDYLVVFDRVFGPVPHRYNLHVTADDIARDGNHIKAAGRFDLDLHCFVQHPAAFKFETGELVPAPARYGEGNANNHRQKFFRIYNEKGDSYRSVLFAGERGRSVSIERVGQCGARITTPEYTDYVFLSDEVVMERTDEASFTGRSGWIRREANGVVRASVADGDSIEAFGTRIEGRGPWSFNLDGHGSVEFSGVPRGIEVVRQ